jgi:hypothetical protein
MSLFSLSFKNKSKHGIGLPFVACNGADTDEFSYGSLWISIKVFSTFYNLQGVVRVQGRTFIPVINWKRISRGLSSGKKAANNRSPTTEELRKLCEYPGRSIIGGMNYGIISSQDWLVGLPTVEAHYTDC